MTVAVVILSVLVVVQMVVIWFLKRASSAMVERAFHNDMALSREAKALVEEHGLPEARALVQSKVEQYEALKISTRDAGEAEVSLGHWQDEIRWRHLDAQVVEIEAEARRNRDGTWE